MEDKFIDREVIDLYTRVAREYKERVYTEELIIYQSRGLCAYSNMPPQDGAPEVIPILIARSLKRARERGFVIMSAS